MKAAILDKYDKQGRSLTITDVPIPEIENGEVPGQERGVPRLGTNRERMVVKA